jgi:hypothetical protein
MKIDPSNSGPAQESGPGRLGEAAPPRNPRKGTAPTPEPVSPPADRVELSAAARELQRQASMDPAAVIDPARLREVVSRLAEGFYDRPEVRREVVRRLAGELD